MTKIISHLLQGCKRFILILSGLASNSPSRKKAIVESICMKLYTSCNLRTFARSPNAPCSKLAPNLFPLLLTRYKTSSLARKQFAASKAGSNSFNASISLLPIQSKLYNALS